MRKRDKKYTYYLKGTWVLLRKWLEEKCDLVPCTSPQQADMVVFFGFDPVHPAMFNQRVMSCTKTNSTTIEKDYRDGVLFSLTQKLKHRPLLLGFQRGAILLNTLSGGSTFQYVGTSHAKPHSLVVTGTNEVFHNVPSCHEDMMVPSKEAWSRDIMALAYNPLTKTGNITPQLNKRLPHLINKPDFMKAYTRADYDPNLHDVEMLWYRSTNSLCIQTAPYTSALTSEGTIQVSEGYNEYCQYIITRKLDFLKARRSTCAVT